MDAADDAANITQLLHAWQTGSEEAFGRLVPMIYEELRVIAARQLSREWRHDRLNVTAVVSEAYVRLLQQQQVDWQNRGHFFAIAARLMRRILIDHGRLLTRQKRGGVELPLALDEASAVATDNPTDAVDALDLDRALSKLESFDPGQARMIELRFFGGLTIEETAAALGISPATVKREWAVAKGWLYGELTGARGPDSA
ncbi:MAG: sigma-70 family RNA polymerase sigma factor [Acidobacteria bacterium]|nr:sigma-70 family RNA polymerase sigma factor [Acidobacteriota bacterium]